MINKVFFLFFLLLSFKSVGQIVRGTVVNSNLSGFPKVVVKIKDKSTRTDSEGRFVIRVEGEFPHYVTFSMTGYETEIIQVNSEEEEVSVVMKEVEKSETLVVSASRTAERVLESPVTVGRLSMAEIERASANSFYEEMDILKGVNKLESGYNYQSLNTRGFAGFNNNRFIQLVDGCDNSLPALNYAQGNVNGVSELDLVGVELLHGASSSLYGANAYNGIILLNTKNPFDHPGIAVKVKSGIMTQKYSGSKPFYDASVRLAHQFNTYFAAKLNYSHRDAEVWHSNDLRAVANDGTQEVINSPSNGIDYNGLNIYGDELVEGVLEFDKKSTKVRRKGYHENDLIDNFRNKSNNISSSLHFRFLEPNPIELQLGIKYTNSNSIDPFGSSKLVKRDYVYNQYKAEIKNKDFFIRAYLTKNDAGRSYDISKTAFYLNRIKDLENNGGKSFYGHVKKYLEDKYAVNYEGNYYRAYDIAPEQYIEAKKYAHNKSGSFDVNSTEFSKTLKTITDFREEGSQLYDKSKLSHVEGNYNFKSLLKELVDFQVGGSFREYKTDTQGTILNDLNKNIKVSEYGAYTQLQKSMLKERLKLTTSLRYDKTKNFDGNYSPRLALNVVMGKEKNHVFRLSYQSAFRNPSIQEQYLNSYQGDIRTIGFIPENLDNISIDIDDYVNLKNEASNISGKEILNNSVVTSELRPITGSAGRLVKNSYSTLKNESIKTYELGYRNMVNVSILTRIDFDFDAFYSINKNLIHTQNISVSKTGTFFPKGTRILTDDERATLSNEISDYNIKRETDLANVGEYENKPEIKYNELVENDIQLMDIDAHLDVVNNNDEQINILVNSKTEIASYGFSFSLNSRISDKYDLGMNYSFINFDRQKFIQNFGDDGFFIPTFNTPKHTLKTYVGADRILYNLGFKLNMVWQDSYRWISSVKAEIPSRTVFNGHVNYYIPSMMSTIKLGGTNLTGKEYQVAPGYGNIGSTFYVSWTIEN